MRRTGHVRERSPGSFELRYTLGTDPATGKRKMATATVRGTRKDADKELRRLLKSLDDGVHVEPSRMTLGQWLETWLATVRQEISPKSAERYGEIVATYIKPKLGAAVLAKLNPTQIQAAYTELAMDPRQDGKEGHLSASSRQYVHRVLSAALSRAVEQQLIARNPADAFRNRLPKIERPEFTALSPDQSAKLLAGIQRSTVYWAVLVALATGMRRGEILALRWRNVDLDTGIVRVVESLEQTKGSLRFKAPKTDRTRSITLPAFAVAELRRLRKEQAETLLKLGIRQTGESLVCARQDGEPLPPHSLSLQFRRQLAKVEDVPMIRFHDLRHTHASQLLAAGTHAKVVQERLGHSTITLTLNTYSHLTATMQEDAASQLDAALGGAIRGAKET